MAVGALVALHRFGLGGRPGDAARVAGDPRGYVRGQLGRPADALLGGAGLPTGEAAYRANRMAELQRDRQRAAGPLPVVIGPDGKPRPNPPAPPPIEEMLYRAEIEARFNRMATTDAGLLERLVLFWSNHFAVSIAKGNHLRVLAGPFEREAIRPHVLGRFVDMLQAAESHPAMLFYLDNNQSIGPDSRAGDHGKRGLNENLAREILELHTLGVDGGYHQADVTSFARVITGWTVNSPDDDALYGGRFTFAPSRHEPGAQTVAAKMYDEDGLAQGRAVLDDLARHPATAAHVAHKLAAHFVADTPPPALVARLAEAFRKSEGDLAVVTHALIDAPEVWDSALSKVRTPQDFVVAGLRAAGKVPDAPAIAGALSGLGQPLWLPPGPNGWGDSASDWASPRAFAARLDLAAQWGRANAGVDPTALVEAVLGVGASAETRAAVGRSESRAQGLAILFMAPEFQRR